MSLGWDVGECLTSHSLFSQVHCREPYNLVLGYILIIFTHHLVYQLGLLWAESNSVVVSLSLIKRGLELDFSSEMPPGTLATQHLPHVASQS